jgi:hypothetical protein
LPIDHDCSHVTRDNDLARARTEALARRCYSRVDVRVRRRSRRRRPLIDRDAVMATVSRRGALHPRARPHFRDASPIELTWRKRERLLPLHAQPGRFAAA